MYRQEARYCVISELQEYLDWMWTVHEAFRSAVARMLQEKGRAYVLPIGGEARGPAWHSADRRPPLAGAIHHRRDRGDARQEAPDDPAALHGCQCGGASIQPSKYTVTHK